MPIIPYKIPKRKGIAPIFLEDGVEQEVYIAINKQNKPIASARAFLILDGGYDAITLQSKHLAHGVFVRIPPTPWAIDYYMLLVIAYHEDGTKTRLSFDLYSTVAALTHYKPASLRYRVVREKTASGEPK